jgi:hypothetical protein
MHYLENYGYKQASGTRWKRPNNRWIDCLETASLSNGKQDK